MMETMVQTGLDGDHGTVMAIFMCFCYCNQWNELSTFKTDNCRYLSTNFVCMQQ